MTKIIAEIGLNNLDIPVFDVPSVLAISCDYCGLVMLKPRYEVNKHNRNGYVKWFCSKKCSSENQRKYATKEIFDANKKEYNKLYHLNRYYQDNGFREKKLVASRFNRDRKKTRGRWIARKEKAIDMFGGKCSCCGYDKCIAALDFHHIDPTEKNERVTFSLKWEKVEQELKKCALLCANCHRELHYKWSENG